MERKRKKESEENLGILTVYRRHSQVWLLTAAIGRVQCNWSARGERCFVVLGFGGGSSKWICVWIGLG